MRIILEYSVDFSLQTFVLNLVYVKVYIYIYIYISCVADRYTFDKPRIRLFAWIGIMIQMKPFVFELAWIRIPNPLKSGSGVR